MRQQHGIDTAMGDVELGADGVGHAVVQPQPRRVERQARHTGGVVHLFPGQQVCAVLKGQRQEAKHQRNRFLTQRVGEIVGSLGDVCLQRVGQHIHTCVGRYRGRGGNCKLRVQNGDRRAQRLAVQRILDPLCPVGDHGVVRDLRAGAAGGGHGKALPPVCVDVQSLLRHRPDGLGRVDGGAAAHGDHDLRAAVLKGLDAGRHHLDGGIRHHAVKYRYLAPGQVPRHLIRHTDTRHKTVGHNHNFFVLHPAQAFQRALTKKDSGAEAEFLHVSPPFPALQGVCAAGISPPPAP